MKLELSNRTCAGVFAALLLVAAVFSYLNIALASAQMGGVTLVARFVTGTLPTEDPNAASWGSATAVTIPLSAQNDLIPTGGGSVTSLAARALNNGTQIAFLLEYTDATNNTDILKKETFRDSAALQFPLAGGMGGGMGMDACMGGIMMNPVTVNIWHWKADWDQDRLVKYQEPKDDYPNMIVHSYPFDGNATYLAGRAAGNVFSQATRPKVENTNATGPSTLATATSQTVVGKGAYASGRWKVVLSRPMTTTTTTDAQFARGQTTGIAFAVWNGGNNERNGMKSASAWQNLTVQ
jgi:dimethylsulfide dehydrogenase subunit gamma/complex iron-sulfur molybdoenzyme family reductase subunit gamma